MVRVVGVGMAMHFSPKDLRLSVGTSGIVFGQSELDLWIVMGISKTDCRIVDWILCAAFVLLLKMNGMLVMSKLC